MRCLVVGHCPGSCSWLEPRERTLVDERGEQVGMLGRGEMATGQQTNVEASGTQPRAGRRNLSGLVRVVLAAGNTKADRIAQRMIQPGEIPASGMGFVLA